MGDELQVRTAAEVTQAGPVGFHGGRAYRVVDYGPRGWASTG